MMVQIALFWMILNVNLGAEIVRVAVSANFSKPMKLLIDSYHKQHGNRIFMTSGSSGKLYAQILHGAPFDLFFCADASKVRRLEGNLKRNLEPSYPFATGKLVLWGRHSTQPPLARLKRGDFNRLAIANPKHAPFGRAAKQTLKNLGLWDKYADRMVFGQSVGQTYQIANSQSAALAVVSLSQIIAHAAPKNYWEIPQTLYEPIVQRALLLTKSKGAKAFFEFSKKSLTPEQLKRYGYATYK